MQATPLAGTRLASALSGFMTETVDVLAETTVRDTFGYGEPTWAVVAGLTGLDAAVGAEDPQTNQATVAGLAEREIVAVRVHLSGSYPQVTTAHRVLWDAAHWRIVHVFPDPVSSFTVLSCERVTPGV